MASCISDEDFECIEQFLVLLCNITSPCLSVKHWNNISSEPCCKAGRSVRVINEVPLDSLISKAFCNKIMLFMKPSFGCT